MRHRSPQHRLSFVLSLALGGAACAFSVPACSKAEEATTTPAQSAVRGMWTRSASDLPERSSTDGGDGGDKSDGGTGQAEVAAPRFDLTLARALVLAESSSEYPDLEGKSETLKLYTYGPGSLPTVTQLGVAKVEGDTLRGDWSWDAEGSKLDVVPVTSWSARFVSFVTAKMVVRPENAGANATFDRSSRCPVLPGPKGFVAGSAIDPKALPRKPVEGVPTVTSERVGYGSIAIDAAGYAHWVYGGATGIRLATTASPCEPVEVALGGAGGTTDGGVPTNLTPGHHAIALDSKGKTHLFYPTKGIGSKLGYANDVSGSFVSSEVAPNQVGSFGVVRTDDDSVHVVAVDMASKQVRHYAYAGGANTPGLDEVVDPTAGVVWGVTKGPGTEVVALLSNAGRAGLSIARKPGNDWSTTVVPDEVAQGIAVGAAIAIDARGSAHIALEQEDAPGGEGAMGIATFYLTNASGSWTRTRVVASAPAGIAVDSANGVHIATPLAYAFKTAEAFTLVDPKTGAPFDPTSAGESKPDAWASSAIAVDARNRVHMSFGRAYATNAYAP